MPGAWAQWASRSRWRWAPHLRVINDHLVDLAERRIRRLMIIAPPRHGKSQLISQYFPSWYLGRYPDHNVILASYGEEFAATWGRRARDALEAAGQEVFGVRIRQDSSAANRWQIAGREGGMVTAGIGGGISGRGANLLALDDPIKDFAEANSRTYRDRAWEWWRSTALTRLEPAGVAALMTTRWHEDDLAGRILAGPDAADWVVLNFPAIAEFDEDWETWTRPEGAALWPRRYPVERLLKIKESMGSYWWNALFQGHPSAPEGNIIKRSWFRYYRILQDGAARYYELLGPGGGATRVDAAGCWTFQTCDPAATKNDRSDWFVLATWAVTPARDLLLLDVFREHAETTQHERILRDQWALHRPAFQGVEKSSYGLNIIQGCVKAGLPIKALPAEGDKVARVKSVAARYEVGAVYHRLGAPWLGEWEDELVDFPTGAHDDQVDAAAYAGIELVHSSQFGVGFGIG